MDLNQLLLQHRIACADMANAGDAEARRWASECADYFDSRIIDTRGRMVDENRMFACRGATASHYRAQLARRS